MSEFMVMVGKLFMIICLESILDIFVSDRRSRYMNKLISIGCYCGGLYVVINFAFNYLFGELFSILRMYF